MRFASFLASSGLVALAWASGSADNATARMFTSSGTADQGFTIPEELPEGVYSVKVDESGMAHHTRVGDISGPFVNAEPEPDVVARSSTPRTPSRLQKRYWGYECKDHIKMQSAPTDRAVAALRKTCGKGLLAFAGTHHYAIANGDGQRIAAFYCRHAGSGYCTDEETRYRYESITGVCGLYSEGWSDWWDGRFSQMAIGYHPVNPRGAFCGRNHDQ
ncbi:hypothetical protein PpBr36_01929 [Pyricularia pennisetigena]|uniref:hypothetical protein n=1 Tax=Pyricularia pennisetigena TaxID=1578925 RepID=UPI001154C9E9|nr:hypothetical protein PpBr36_01929 [Pyricularia pennisetigena]TLS28386.1 hypothetical protein PpBr36_01929 [Pyricularia pennisetigena]